jgi:hypothetical protein
VTYRKWHGRTRPDLDRAPADLDRERERIRRQTYLVGAEARRQMWEAREAARKERAMKRYYILPRTKRRLEAGRRLGRPIRPVFFFSEDSDPWVLIRAGLLAVAIAGSVVILSRVTEYPAIAAGAILLTLAFVMTFVVAWNR